MFSFTPDKAAACRVTCGARLELPEWVLDQDVEALTGFRRWSSRR
ncbi:hypothetical protein [Streptomyces alanosinicus]|nr:hypothetical protein [Streptomyces alanosinicus]